MFTINRPHRYARDRFWKQLDHSIDLLLKKWRITWWKGSHKEVEGPSSTFVLIKDILYKRGFSHSYLRCLSPKEVDCVMREVHERICENHSGSRSLVHKLIRDGYYWPTMQKDAQTYVKIYDKCQRLSNVIRRKNSPQWQSRGHLLSGDWTSWAHSQ